MNFECSDLLSRVLFSILNVKTWLASVYEVRHLSDDQSSLVTTMVSWSHPGAIWIVSAIYDLFDGLARIWIVSGQLVSSDSGH